MLGVLRMDINTCINEYLEMAPEIFPIEDHISGSTAGRLIKVVRGRQRFDPRPLEAAVKRLVKDHLRKEATEGEATPLRFRDSSNEETDNCKV